MIINQLLKTKKLFLLNLLFVIFAFGCSKNSDDNGTVPVDNSGTGVATPTSDVAFWMTRADKYVLFQKQKVNLVFSSSSNSNPTIDVDTTQTYQTIDGFGFALTGGSATLINSLSDTKKEALLKELFSTDSTAIGISYLRISIGASDLSAAPFTYDEVPSGQTDDELESFSIDQEKTDLIPVLRKMIALDPDLKIIATPWTAPTWMKTTGSYEGGQLLKADYDAYARYFVKYILAMESEGINIDAVTPQNEPLNAYNNPSMLLDATDEADFIGNYLGPQFAANDIDTRIIAYDHNLDHPEYALTVLGDEKAGPYTNGSAFHLYAGAISTMTAVHNSFPDKSLYFTEQYTSSTGSFNGDLQWHIKNLIIGATRNWSRNVLEWNLASGPDMEPHTNGGCTTCLGAVTIGPSTVTRNVSYYIIAHASKFVRPGSVRIASTIAGNLENVAFKTPEGKKILIVLNDGSSTAKFNIRYNGKIVSPTLMAGAVGTFVW